MTNNIKSSNILVLVGLHCKGVPELEQRYQLKWAAGFIGEAKEVKVNDKHGAIISLYVGISTIDPDVHLKEPFDGVVVFDDKVCVLVNVLEHDRDIFISDSLGKQLSLQSDLLGRGSMTLVFTLLWLFHSGFANISEKCLMFIIRYNNKIKSS